MRSPRKEFHINYFLKVVYMRSECTISYSILCSRTLYYYRAQTISSSLYTITIYREPRTSTYIILTNIDVLYSLRIDLIIINKIYLIFTYHISMIRYSFR